ncbi:MAG: CaiB/BaiF CoA-transferase family protein, partial [Geminicoccaceae bacterium]|nr:CaiB/BaiF CoA-transferase family protein [Geminicoccaceae bacterium]
MQRDLDGILVASLEQAVAAPYATRLLADAGARVIKIERPEGDFARAYDAYAMGLSVNFVWLNRGKQSIALDLKKPEDRALLERILAKADVFVQNLAPGAARRLGLGSAELRARFPRLVTCDISGYGEEGPWKDLKAYDLLVQAESGIASVNGIGDEPARVGVSICDIAAGITAAAAIFRALFARERTGRGQGIEVSLFHSIGDWMNVPWMTFAYGGFEPPRLGLHHPTIAPYGAYACGDGKTVLIAIQNEREWARFCAEVLGRPELATDARFASNPERVKNRVLLDAVILDAFAGRDRDAVIAALEAAKIAYGRLSTLADLSTHPQMR